MRFCNGLLGAVVVGFTAVCAKQDPWEEASNILNTLPRQEDPMAAQRSGSVDSTSGAMFIPMDYIPEEEERRYAQFWDETATPLQKKVYRLLEQSSEEYNNPEATYVLAQMHLWSDYRIPHNKTLAYKYMNRFNEQTNFTNSSALFDLAVMHSTGLFGTIPIDVAKSVVYFQQAALLGDFRAKQALAYRYYFGINVPRDCNMALLLYRELAEDVRNRYTDEEWNVIVPYLESYNVRIPDFHEGLLGKGLNSMSLSTTRMDSKRPDITSSLLTHMNGGQIVLQFGLAGSTSVFAGDGDDESDDRLVDIFYTALDKFKGTYEKKRDCYGARQLLEISYKEYDADVPFMDNLQKFYYGRCLGLLGHIYYTGEGLDKPDLKVAETFLSKAVKIVESASTATSRANIDLGLINEYHYNNITEALKYYKKVRDSLQNDGTVDYRLSSLLQKQPNIIKDDPFILMQTAYMRGHLLATYEYAKMIEQGANNHYSCEDTAFLFKKFVEMNQPIVAPQMRSAFAALMNQNVEAALWGYAQAAEQGFETAQISAAYILYQNPYLLEAPPITSEERKVMAISYYNRAFKQNNVDAAIIAGNIYYDMGQYSKAVSMYQISSLRFSSQGVWNLGYMYEHGLGVEKDFYMAKRYYDQVLEYNPKLYLAVKASILKLRVKSWFLSLTGDINNYWPGTETEKVEAAPWYKNIVESFKKANRENSGGDIIEGRQHGAAVPPIEDVRVGLLDRLDLQLEDIITIAFMLSVFIFTMVMRTLAVRRGWNMRINGVDVHAANQPQAENDGGIDFNFRVFVI